MTEKKVTEGGREGGTKPIQEMLAHLKKLFCPAWQLASSVLFFFFSVKKKYQKSKPKNCSALPSNWHHQSFFSFFSVKKNIKNQNQKIALPCLAIGIISHFFLFSVKKNIKNQNKKNCSALPGNWQHQSFFSFFSVKKNIKNKNKKIALPCLAIGNISNFFFFSVKKKISKKNCSALPGNWHHQSFFSFFSQKKYQKSK